MGATRPGSAIEVLRSGCRSVWGCCRAKPVSRMAWRESPKIGARRLEAQRVRRRLEAANQATRRRAEDHAQRRVAAVQPIVVRPTYRQMGPCCWSATKVGRKSKSWLCRRCGSEQLKHGGERRVPVGVRMTHWLNSSSTVIKLACGMRTRWPSISMPRACGGGLTAAARSVRSMTAHAGSNALTPQLFAGEDRGLLATGGMPLIICGRWPMPCAVNTHPRQSNGPKNTWISFGMGQVAEVVTTLDNINLERER